MALEDISQLWKLHDRLTINQAAALIAGYDPEEVEFLRRKYLANEHDESDKPKYCLNCRAQRTNSVFYGNQ